MAKKRATVHLEGAAKANAKVVKIEAKITDPNYEVAFLKDDIQHKRVWLEAQPDADGWTKLLYSADGPTGDPISIGKIKVNLDSQNLDPNFGDFSELTFNEAKKE
jgi:hypothetical protein